VEPAEPFGAPREIASAAVWHAGIPVVVVEPPVEVGDGTVVGGVEPVLAVAPVVGGAVDDDPPHAASPTTIAPTSTTAARR
jgi:hypothetical protein